MRTIPLTVCLLAACSAPLRLYEGPPREAVAHLHPDKLLIHSVDGRKIDAKDSLDRRTLELLPGEHTVRIEWSGGGGAATDRLVIGPRGRAYGPKRVGVVEQSRRYFAEIVFVAEAGQAYKGIWIARDDGSGRQPAITNRDS